jgi:hypothetical protein
VNDAAAQTCECYPFGAAFCSLSSGLILKVYPKNPTACTQEIQRTQQLASDSRSSTIGQPTNQPTPAPKSQSQQADPLRRSQTRPLTPLRPTASHSPLETSTCHCFDPRIVRNKMGICIVPRGEFLESASIWSNGGETDNNKHILRVKGPGYGHRLLDATTMGVIGTLTPFWIPSIGIRPGNLAESRWHDQIQT